ncbi:MAG TPA: hypothetical protein PLG34_00720 [Spirochaetota bacterium]|jgi:hypothetical protein|nr:MAG: hypothetical protein BWX91_00869 [Spirochaetes bacterium ADurb.Bin133]HNZ27111.1 hypothetical protein [Spirochaetota bacterium]HPY86490.1 hypothetical protein [Spirochaetota bacterium]HQB60981.1 hypothetical protein [Spirochaetota bacterium]
MKTITLKVNDSVSDKFIWFLNHFSRNEIEILDKTNYISDDEYIRSVKGIEESIIKASNEPIENYTTEDELDW